MPRMQMNFDGLVKLLAKNLYPEPDVFIRELIQNAHDGIQLRRAAGDAVGGRIDITIDQQAGTMTFADNGIGMGQDEIEEYLSTIGKTGTGTLTEQFSSRDVLVETIGQFGVGLLSAFVVAERIDIYTRKMDTGTTWHWVNHGKEDYDLTELPAAAQAEGTRVVVTVAKAYGYHLDEERVRDTIKRYADFIPFPISLNGNGPVNAVDAPWHSTAWGSQYDDGALERFLTQRYAVKPLHVLPIAFDRPKARGALYIADGPIPDVNTSGVIDIFQDRMCIRLRDADLLPDWAKFVRGIVDSPDLQPTAARDNLIKNEAYHDLRKALDTLIVTGLTDLARNNPRGFAILCQWHHYHLKGMAAHHDDFFDAVIDLLPFDTNAGELTLPKYLARQSVSPGARLPVYFFSSGLDSNQFYEICSAKGIVAINTGKVFDEQLVRRYVERRGGLELRPLDSLDDPELYQPLPDEERGRFFALEGAMRASLGLRGLGHVQPVTRRFAPEGMSGAIIDTQRVEALERMQSLMQQPFLMEGIGELAEDFHRTLRTAPVQLFLNADNELVRRLAGLSDADLRRHDSILLGLYNSAILYSQHRMTPENAKVFYGQFQQQMLAILSLEDAINRAREEREAWRAQAQADGGGGGAGSERDWTRLFVMMPFESRYDPLERALKEVLQTPPYCFEVLLARDSIRDDAGIRNIQTHIADADGYIADVSEHNANVMLEVGCVHLAPHYADRPLVLLFSETGNKGWPFDFGDRLRVTYPDLDSSGLAEHLRAKFRQRQSLHGLVSRRRKRFLSESLLAASDFLAREADRRKVCAAYHTVEDLLEASAADFAARIHDRRLATMHAPLLAYFGDLPP